MSDHTIRRRVVRLFSREWKKTLILLGVVAVFFILLFCFSKGLIILERYGLTPGNVYKIMFSQGATLESSGGRINILLLGSGGNGHEGGDLTDSILIMSMSVTDKTMALVSIPRDVWSDTLKDKVNSAYHYGEEKNEGGGLPLAKAIITEITGIPINYSMFFDFSVFSDAVDFVGGIDVFVPMAFTDSKYPITGKENDVCDGDLKYGCRYMTVSFGKGVTRMNGARALEYVRSRHSEGNEGTDFARSRRQQDVLLAIFSKATDVRNWVGMLSRIYLVQNMNEKMKTDMTLSEILSYGKILQKLNPNTIQKITVDDLFRNPSEAVYDGKYVLVPYEDYDVVHEFILSSMSGRLKNQ